MKEMLRRKYLNLRRNMTTSTVEQKSLIIYKKVIESNEYKDSKELFTYVSCFNEVDTYNLINHGLANNKKVAVPKTFQNGQIEFFYISSLNEMKIGRYNILEPVSTIKAIPKSISARRVCKGTLP